MRSFFRKTLSKICIAVLIVSIFYTSLGTVHATNNITPLPTTPESASSCHDLNIIFARGSGEPADTNPNFTAFRSNLKSRLTTLAPKLDYTFYDLGTSSHGGHQYPAVAADNLSTLTGAVISAGNSYDFGNSVQEGINELKSYISEISKKCPSTKFALAGYSQGAIVISKSLPKLPASRIIYAATFGDPKLYLPEGKGLFPDACSNHNLSDYRTNVPDCRVSEGILGALNPYQTSSYLGKLGTWCNEGDFMCGSSFNILNPLASHLSYKSSRYDEAAKIIAKKASLITPSSDTDNNNPGSSNDTDSPGSGNVLFSSIFPYLESNPAPDSGSLQKGALIRFVIACSPLTADGSAEVTHYTMSDGSSTTLYTYTFFDSSIYTKCLAEDANFDNSGLITTRPKSFKQVVQQAVNDHPDYRSTDIAATIVEYDATCHDSTLHIIASYYGISPTNTKARTISTHTSVNATLASSLAPTSPKSELIENPNYSKSSRTLTFDVNLPDDSIGLILTLNESVLGIITKDTILQSQNKITITDLDPTRTNLITIKNIGSSGYVTSSITHTIPAPNHIDNKKQSFPSNLKAPDCGTPSE